MSANKSVEVVGEQLIEDLEVLIEVARDIEALERRVAGCYAVDGHEELRLQDVDEKIAFVGMVVMASKFDGLAAKVDGLRGFEGHGGHQPVGIVLSYSEVGDASKRDDMEAGDSFEGRRCANVILVCMRVDQHLDRLVGHLSDRGRNALAEAGRCVEADP